MPLLRFLQVLQHATGGIGVAKHSEPDVRGLSENCQLHLLEIRIRRSTNVAQCPVHFGIKYCH